MGTSDLRHEVFRGIWKLALSLNRKAVAAEARIVVHEVLRAVLLGEFPGYGDLVEVEVGAHAALTGDSEVHSLRFAASAFSWGIELVTRYAHAPDNEPESWDPLYWEGPRSECLIGRDHLYELPEDAIHCLNRVVSRFLQNGFWLFDPLDWLQPMLGWSGVADAQVQRIARQNGWRGGI